MLPSLGFAASSLRASGQVPDAVWCGSLAIIIEQCGSNKTSELFQSFRCFTVFFFFLNIWGNLTVIVTHSYLASLPCTFCNMEGAFKPKGSASQFYKCLLGKQTHQSVCHTLCFPSQPVVIGTSCHKQSIAVAVTASFFMLSLLICQKDHENSIQTHFMQKSFTSR